MSDTVPPQKDTPAEPLRARVADLEARLAEKQQALAHSTEQLERIQLSYGAVLRSTPHGLCMLGPNWRITYANPAMSMILNPSGTQSVDATEMSFAAFFPASGSISIARLSTPLISQYILEGSFAWLKKSSGEGVT